MLLDLPSGQPNERDVVCPHLPPGRRSQHLLQQQRSYQSDSSGSYPKSTHPVQCKPPVAYTHAACITRGASCQHKLHNSSSFFPPGTIPLRSATLQEIYAPVLLRFTRITPILFARCRPTRAVIERLST